jgi:ribosomal protein L37E
MQGDGPASQKMRNREWQLSWKYRRALLKPI